MKTKHTHKWHLSDHSEAYLDDVSENTKKYIPGFSYWLCECGASKKVEII